MKTYKCLNNLFVIALLFFISIQNISIQKQLKELKEVKLIVDNLESQIKLLTPPPEFFSLPIIRGKQ